MKTHIFSKSVRGASHLKNGKPMQDWSESVHLDECNADIILLSDGHGSDKHFRSDIGARFAVEAARESLVEFIGTFTPVFQDEELRQRGVAGIRDPESEDYTPKDIHERQFRQLFENIKYRWCEKVNSHWAANPPSTGELEKANTQGSALSLSYYCSGREVKAYGCTLIAAVKTQSYWLAFQIGDGKCICYNEDGTWYEPIPWDSRCFLNTTTSLCNEGSESFRYCYSNKSCPALFIGSDGMDDSYMPMEKLAEFYAVAVRVAADRGFDFAAGQLEQMMPKISEDGSHDDVSIAFWMDEDSIAELNRNILSSRLSSLENEVKDIGCQKESAITEREGVSRRAEQLAQETQQLESRRAECHTRRRETEQFKKRAEEDYRIAQSLLEDSRINLEHAVSEFEYWDSVSQDMETRFEVHLKEVGTAEDMLKRVESRIRAFEGIIQREFREMESIRKLLSRIRL